MRSRVVLFLVLLASLPVAAQFVGGGSVSGGGGGGGASTLPADGADINRDFTNYDATLTFYNDTAGDSEYAAMISDHRIWSNAIASNVYSQVCAAAAGSACMYGSNSAVGTSSAGSSDNSTGAIWFDSSGSNVGGKIIASGGTTSIDIGTSAALWMKVQSTGVTLAGMSTDLTTGTNEDLVAAPNGSGILTLRAGTGGYVYLQSSAAATNAFVKTSVSGTGVFEGSTLALLSPNGNSAASAKASCLADADGNTQILCAYGAGLSSRPTPQTCDCGTAGTPNTVTCDIQSDVVYLQDGDADACTVTISETTANTANDVMPSVRIIVIANGGGGAFTIADSAGVVELESGTSWTGDQVGDNLSLHYESSGSINSFYEVARRENL